MPTEDDQGRKGLNSQYSNVEEPSKIEMSGVEQVDFVGKVKCAFFRLPFFRFQ